MLLLSSLQLWYQTPCYVLRVSFQLCLLPSNSLLAVHFLSHFTLSVPSQAEGCLIFQTASCSWTSPLWTYWITKEIMKQFGRQKKDIHDLSNFKNKNWPKGKIYSRQLGVMCMFSVLQYVSISDKQSKGETCPIYKFPYPFLSKHNNFIFFKET